MIYAVLYHLFLVLSVVTLVLAWLNPPERFPYELDSPGLVLTAGVLALLAIAVR